MTVTTSNTTTQTKITPATTKSCEIKSVVIVASFAVWVILVVVMGAATVAVAVVTTVLLRTASVMNLEITDVSVSDGGSDALSLLDAIIGFASVIGVENVFVAVMTVPEFALSIPLEELGC